jgi:hypothetical protein
MAIIKAGIKVGDFVEVVGENSGWWVVTEIFRNTPRKTFAAKLVLPNNHDCVTYCEVDRLRVVQDRG